MGDARRGTPGRRVYVMSWPISVLAHRRESETPVSPQQQRWRGEAGERGRGAETENLEAGRREGIEGSAAAAPDVHSLIPHACRECCHRHDVRGGWRREVGGWVGVAQRSSVFRTWGSIPWQGQESEQG